MSKLFPGSGLLISDHAGHCSVSSMTPCTLGHIRTYFQTGNLPPPNTLCIPPPSPFSLNSTDPNSPFYDPSLDGMAPELTLSAKESANCEEATLRRAGISLAKIIAYEDSFGVSRLIGGSGGLAREVMAMAVQDLRVR